MDLHVLPDRKAVSPAEVEAALLEGYPAFVRLAYLILPSSLGRHRRILAAHGIVQRALPDRRRLQRQLVGETDATGFLRRRVLQDAIRQASSRTPLRWLPQVWGLRLFPRLGAVDDLALDQALSTLTPQARAAWALVRAEQLSVDEAELQLRAIGIQHPQAAVNEAALLEEVTAEDPLDVSASDPCAVRLAPTDLMRRKASGRAVAIAVTAVLAAAILISLLATAGSEDPAAAPQAQLVQAPKLTADALLRTPADKWQDTARVDFTAWAPRGDSLTDKALLTKALHAWSIGSGVTAVAGTPTAAPTQSPQLLYSGTVDTKQVVLLYDGQRLARYTDGTGLVVARADDADVTTAAAVVISESAKGVRYLTAPWVATATLRDLVKPNTPAADLTRADGITAEIARPTCDSWPTLQLRSASTVAEKHAFLLTYLGGLSPVHLTYMPPPSSGAARSPREATSSAALLSWAQTACGLQALQGQGVRSANNWIFAEQPLPGGGVGDWVCTRSDAWEGNGWASAALLTPGAPPLQAGNAVNTAACSRFDQNVLASAYWTAPAGGDYLLAAGSRHVDHISLNGHTYKGNLVAQRATSGRARLTAHLTTGTTLTALNK
jgi:DNA-directed RNA polymerase specialized sigma24 family protein